MQTTPSRSKIKSQQAWNEYIQSIQSQAKEGSIDIDINALRFNCYRDIELLRGRPLLIYSTRLTGAPQGAPISIDLDDVDGFTDLVSSLKGSKSVDVLIHSPGGSPDATERIVGILRNAFDEVHFLVPHSAYSAATMLALSGDTITMHTSATLGPIDPQINGVPARAIKRGFDTVKDSLASDGADRLPAYIPLLQQYSLHLLEICEDAERLSSTLVEEWLTSYMFKGQPDAATKISEAVKFFADYDTHLTHSRPLTITKLASYDLKIEQASDELCELLWEAHFLIGLFFSSSSFVKLFENAHGVSWGRQMQQIHVQPQARAEILPIGTIQ